MLIELNAHGVSLDGQWQLVPKEPTSEMQNVAFDVLELNYPFGGFNNGTEARNAVYVAMLSAAPQPPTVSTQGWQDISTAPKDGTHIIGNTQWGALEIWWHKDIYDGEYWTDEGDSEPEPTGWIPKPGEQIAPQPDLLTVTRERDQAREALAWYGEQAQLARLVHSEGDEGRHALAADGGKRARSVLQPEVTHDT